MALLKLSAGFFGITLLIASCSEGSSKGSPDEPDPTPVSPTEKLEIKINPSLSRTKANDSGFEQGDCVGLYVVNYKDGIAGTLQDSGNHVDNMRFTYNDTWEPDRKIYWLDNDTHADIYLYYPYANVTTVTAMLFSVSADQSVEVNYKSSDLLIGKTADTAPTTSAISVLANHVMSRVSITLEAGSGFTAQTLASADVSVKINNLKTEATVNLTDATVAVSGNPSVVTPNLQNGVYRAIVVPQSVDEGDLITVTVEGKDYNFKKGLTFESGKNYNFTLTLSKTTTGINVSIGNWDDDGVDYGGTAE